MREMLENESEYIFQSIISGRRIAIIRLKQGIETILGTINFLELSDQKLDGSQSEGFDHIEVYPVGWTYEEMVRELEEVETVKKVERPHHTTHDIVLEEGFIFRLTQEPLIEKIKRSEMN
jgi:predicted metalloenzyme YecM